MSNLIESLVVAAEDDVDKGVAEIVSFADTSPFMVLCLLLFVAIIKLVQANEQGVYPGTHESESKIPLNETPLRMVHQISCSAIALGS